MNSENFYILPLGATNCYLLPCNDGYLLIDTCYSDSYIKFLKILKKLKIEQEKIHFLLLTHHHDDHAGFASKLSEAENFKIIVHEKAVPQLSIGRTAETMKFLNQQARFAFSIIRLLHKDYSYPPVILSNKDAVITGDNNTLLKEIGIDGEIIETPGHCSDSISVLLKDGSLFSGDLAMGFKNLCGLKYRPILSEDLNEVYRSWEKVKAKGAKWVYPSHGKPFSTERLKL